MTGAAVSPAELEAAKRALLVDADGRLTYAGRNLVGEPAPAELEPLASFTQRWLQLRGPFRMHPRPPGYAEE